MSGKEHLKLWNRRYCVDGRSRGLEGGVARGCGGEGRLSRELGRRDAADR